MRAELRCVKEGAGAQCVLVTVGGAHWCSCSMQPATDGFSR